MRINPRLKAKAPLIFAIAGVGGVIATGVAGVRGGMKAERILAEHEGEDLTTKDKFSLTWRCYIWTIATALATTGCIIASHALSAKQIAALASIGAAGAKTFKEYRGKVREVIGNDAEEKLYEEVRQKTDPEIQMYPPLPNSGGGPDDILFKDMASGTLFYSNFEKVQQAAYHLNRNFRLRGIVSEDDWLMYNGVETDGTYKDLVWDEDEYWNLGLAPWIDIWHKTVPTEDGEICHEIYFEWDPHEVDEDSL